MTLTRTFSTGTAAGTGKWLRPLILAGLLALAAGAQGQQEVTPAQLEALKKEIAGIDRWLQQAERERSTLEQELANAERAISRLTRERRELQGRVRDQEQRIRELQQQAAELEADLNTRKAALKQQIRSAWMEGKAPALKVLLNEADPEKIARHMTWYEYLSSDNLRRLDEFNQTLAQLRETRRESLQARQQLGRLEADAAERQEELARRKQSRQQTLAQLEADIRQRESRRNTLVEDRERLAKLLREVEEAIANIPAPNESRPISKLRGKLPWPVEGRLVAEYGGSIAQGRLKRNGILLNTPEDAEVRAVHYGRVVFANWIRGFGLMTIIDHGEGYMTLYGHSSSLLTSPGDWVGAGDAIALAGRTGGTEDPAVYFEIRRNGKPQNPGQWFAGK